MIDETVLRARLLAIADLYDQQAAISQANRDPRMAAAADNARSGVLAAVNVLDALCAGQVLTPLPVACHDTPRLFDLQEVGTTP